MRLAPALLLALVALAAPAAAAGAATLAPLGACYRSVDATTREFVHVSATGFAPGAAVDVAIDGRIVRAGGQAEPDGRIDGDVPAPYPQQGQRRVTPTGDRPAPAPAPPP